MFKILKYFALIALVSLCCSRNTTVLQTSHGRINQKLICPCGYGIVAIKHRNFSWHDPNITVTCEDLNACDEVRDKKDKYFILKLLNYLFVL